MLTHPGRTSLDMPLLPHRLVRDWRDSAKKWKDANPPRGIVYTCLIPILHCNGMETGNETLLLPYLLD